MEPEKKSFKGDESLEERFDKYLRDDGEGIIEDGDNGEKEEKPKKRPPTRRELRIREREEKRKKEEEEFRNINEYWYKDPNIAVKIPKLDAPFEELDAALSENRLTLEELKHAYCRSRRRQYKIVTDAYFHEIKRHVNAIEGIKDALVARGDDFRVFYTDREHPIEACRRIVFDCFIVSTLYGPYAHETNVFRFYRDVKLAPTPWGRWFINVYYSFLGPKLSRILEKSPLLQNLARTLMDRILVRIKRTL